MMVVIGRECGGDGGGGGRGNRYDSDVIDWRQRQ